MIFTHPVLFNLIVVFFIAFTAGWIVYAFASRRNLHLKNKVETLELEKEKLRLHAQQLEMQSTRSSVVSNTPVIPLSSAIKISKTNSAGF